MGPLLAAAAAASVSLCIPTLPLRAQTLSMTMPVVVIVEDAVTGEAIADASLHFEALTEVASKEDQLKFGVGTFLVSDETEVALRRGLYRFEFTHPSYITTQREVRVMGTKIYVRMGMVKRPPGLFHWDDPTSKVPLAHVGGVVLGPRVRQRTLWIRSSPLSSTRSASISDVRVGANGEFRLSLEMGSHIVTVLEESRGQKGRAYRLIHSVLVQVPFWGAKSLKMYLGGSEFGSRTQPASQ